jgi:hypothetical protein
MKVMIPLLDMIMIAIFQQKLGRQLFMQLALLLKLVIK